MEQRQAWEAISQELYKKANLFDQHAELTSLNIGPLSFEGESLELPRPSQMSSPFYNINTFQPETWSDEFLATAGAGLYWTSKTDLDLDRNHCLIYCQTSPQWTETKKVLQGKALDQALDLGIDPFSLGLWKSQLFKNNVTANEIMATPMALSRIFRINTQSYAIAGANAIQQLAIVLSSVVELIEEYQGQIEPDELMARTSVELALKPNLGTSIAQLIAMSLLLDRLREIYDCEHLIPVYATASARFLSAREPWNNLLRLTAINMAAQMGGASGVVQVSMDFLSGDQAGRLSRNLAEILQRESFLQAVSHPSLGSFSWDQLTSELCEKSWVFFKEIEKKGGIREVLRSGWIHDEINSEEQKQRQLFLQRKMKIVGVNQYAILESLNKEVPFPAKHQVLSLEDWWQNQIDEGKASKLCDIERLIPQSLCHLLEQWQFRGDQLRKTDRHKAQVLFMSEPDFKNNKKIMLAKETLALGGLDFQLTGLDELGRHCVVVLFAADPDGDFINQTVAKLRESGNHHILWGGEKNQPQFDDFVGQTSDLMTLFSKIYNHLEAGL